MAQGAGMKTAKPNPGLNKSAAKSKKGTGIMKPQKKHNKTAADKVTKKYTAGMVAQTEKMLGARAGHLELIGKGRKKQLADGDKIQKGGTRKFG